MTHLSAHLLSNMTQLLHDSSPSVAVVNGEQSCKAKKFCGDLTNYNLLLYALDVSSIYTPKSGEDAPITRGIGDLGGPTLYQPRMGFTMTMGSWGS